MFAIQFDSVLFTNLETLSSYVAGAYGSWSQVPDDHPQIGLVESLAVLNTSYYEDREGVVIMRPQSEWPVLEEDDKESYYDDDWPQLDYCPQYAACQPWLSRTGICPDCPHL